MSSGWFAVTPLGAHKALAALSVLGFIACSVYDDSLLAGAKLSLDEPGGNAGVAAAGNAPAAAGGDVMDRGGSNNGGNGGQEDTSESGRAGEADDGAGNGGRSNGGASGNASGGKSSGGTSNGGTSNGGAGSGGSAGATTGGVGAGGSTGSGGSATAGSSGGGAGPAPIELATGKSFTMSSEQVGHEAIYANDGVATTRWCASAATFPQWWRVDLGAAHTLAAFSVQFEHSDRQYSYRIETSTDDLTYAQQASFTNRVGAAQSGAFPASLSARYVRISIVSTVPLDATHLTWASIFEFSVTGT